MLLNYIKKIIISKIYYNNLLIRIILIKNFNYFEFYNKNFIWDKLVVAVKMLKITMNNKQFNKQNRK